MMRCNYAKIIDKETYICNKYNTYCYFDSPNYKHCLEIYGKDYNEDNEVIRDEEGEEFNE